MRLREAKNNTQAVSESGEEGDEEEEPEKNKKIQKNIKAKNLKK